MISRSWRCMIRSNRIGSRSFSRAITLKPRMRANVKSKHRSCADSYQTGAPRWDSPFRERLATRARRDPDEKHRSECRRLSNPESLAVTAGPIVEQTAEPWTDARADADEKRHDADDRAERLAVKQIGGDGRIERLPRRESKGDKRRE